MENRINKYSHEIKIICVEKGSDRNGSIRKIELTLREDSTGLSFSPSAATVQIVDSDNDIISQGNANIEDNKVSYTVYENITTNVDKYLMKWKFYEDGEVYTHITVLTILEE